MSIDGPAPREDLIRFVRFDDRVEVRSDSSGRPVLAGYAAVFDSPTTIDSWEGRFVETLSPGAFKRTLNDRADKIKVLFNHGNDPAIGDKPLGKPRVIREDNHGLYVEVPLDPTSYNADIEAGLRSGALDGMSFRMTVINDEWTEPKGSELPERTIREVRLYEVSVVTFPAYEATTAGVRAHAPRAAAAWDRVNRPAKPTPRGRSIVELRRDREEIRKMLIRHDITTVGTADIERWEQRLEEMRGRR